MRLVVTKFKAVPRDIYYGTEKSRGMEPSAPEARYCGSDFGHAIALLRRQPDFESSMIVKERHKKGWPCSNGQAFQVKTCIVVPFPEICLETALL